MRLNSALYVLRETGNSLRRNPWLSAASVLTVMVSLVILGFSVFFLINASNMAKTFESELEIAVFVQNGTTPQDLDNLKKQIESMSGVASVSLVTKDQALADFSKSMGDGQSNLLSDLGGTNPFPDKLTVKAANPQTVKTLADSFSSLPGVEKVRYGQGFVDKLLKFTTWLRWIGVGVISAFAVASIVLISINIKMNLFSRRREIQIMKLVGASNSFVRWPFLVEGLALGFMGGSLAAVVVGLAYQWLAGYVRSTLTFLPVVQNSLLVAQILMGLLVAGMGIGALGSAISLRKFLRV